MNSKSDTTYTFAFLVSKTEERRHRSCRFIVIPTQHQSSQFSQRVQRNVLYYAFDEWCHTTDINIYHPEIADNEWKKSCMLCYSYVSFKPFYMS